MLSTLSSTGLTFVVTLFLCQIRISQSQSRLPIDLDCLSGWQVVGLNCYKLFLNRLPWTSAERTCVGYGGHLATPFDFFENEDAAKFVNDRGADEFWIGFIGADRIGVPPNDNRLLQYRGGLETYMWAGYWNIYQPKFSDGDCVYVAKDKKQLHKWSFGSCEKNSAFLCQRPVCAQGSFHCVNGNCVSPNGQCDGFDDCGDRSDETNCPGSCSYYIRASGKGFITYPSSGSNYPDNADCSWLIEADIGFNVQLTVTSLSLESNSDELIVMDGGLTESDSRELVRLTGTLKNPKYFYSSDNKMLIKFRSDKTVTSTGFSLSYDLVNTSQPLQNVLIATQMWQEQAFPYYNTYVLGNQDVFYIVEAQDSKQTITVEVLEMDLPDDASVIVRNGMTVSDSIIANNTGTFKGNGIFLSTGRYLYIALHTVRGGPYQGLKIRYMQGCGGSANQTTGYIYSPGYKVSFYPNSVTCNWTVNVPGAQNVTIQFSALDVHVSDTIQIIERNSVIGNYTGDNSYKPVRITSGQFSIVFISSATLNSRGFNITYSVDCPKPMIDLNVSVINGELSESYGSRFTVSCQQGSRFSQAEHMNMTTVAMACNAYGQWNVNTSPKCERIRCARAPGLQNGYILGSTGNLTYGGTVTYKCYQGFKLVGSDTVTCDANGQWVNIPYCEASTCSMAPQSDSNGSQNITFGDGRLYGSILRYSCNQGYDLIGDPTMFCDTNGSWVGKAGTCKSLTCYTQNIPNGVLSSNIVDVGQQVTLTCNTGYKTDAGQATMMCNSNRTFTPMLSCQDINECDDNRTCQHNCVNTIGSYYCTCDPGFEVLGGSCRDIDECAMNPCNDTCSNTIGSYQCSCHPGYSLFVVNGIQGRFIPATEDGTLAGDVYRLNHSCVRNLCTSPPVIANTDLLSLKTNYYYEDTVKYKCQLGYMLENSSSGTLTCNETGNWTGPEVKCMRAMCTVDQVPSNLINPGTVSPQNMTISFGEQINITCRVPGFTPDTFSRTRKCTLIGADYKLDGSVNDYECEFITCGMPGVEPGSVYTGPSKYYFNDNFTFGCLPSFKLEGASILTNNTTVTCLSNGQWDFGDLHCTGIQCLDPGQPFLGKQIASDYRVGQLVIFQCLFPGYTLSSPYPISCVLVQNVTRYNATLPICLDAQNPTITNCPKSEILIGRMQSAGSVVPELQTQDNGGIRSLEVSPAWPHSQFYVKALTTTFIYTVKDYGANQYTCTITLRRKDDTPPNIICPTVFNYTFRSDNETQILNFNRSIVRVRDDQTQPGNLSVMFSPTNFTFSLNGAQLDTFPPTYYKTVNATVMDAAGNSASCIFGIYFYADQCSPYYFRTPPNSARFCTENGQGYTCTITCNDGYFLYNNVTAKSVTKSCYKQSEAFPPGPDVKCVNTSSLDGNYKLEYDYFYEGKNVSNSCKLRYENIIKDTVKELTVDKSLLAETFCGTSPVSVSGNISLGSVTVFEAEKKVLVRYIINFDRRSGSRYSDCADGVKLLMNRPESYLPVLLQFQPLECENITVTMNRSLIYDGYFCEDGKNQLISPTGIRNLSFCLPCPEGTYSINGNCTPCPLGTFGSMSNMVMCQSCPINTSTYTTGAVSVRECASLCDPGTISDNGLPPCFPCPLNKYWTNATTCLSCPSNTVTRVHGSKSQEDCKVQCLPGTYNEIDGYAECRPCPMHYYSNVTGSNVSCTECGSDEYTNSPGKTSPSDCIKLNLTLCACSHGTCKKNLLAHVMSCVCDNGWTGESCNKSFNPCDSHPCLNNGSCSGTGSNYVCSCLPGSSGRNCEKFSTTCTNDYCQNNGMCENLVNTAICHCLTGFTGDRCQTTQDICSSQPCKSGGTCISIGNVHFSCICPSGRTGKTCEESADDCYLHSCRNNGTCLDGDKTFNCSCDTAYTGLNCEVRKQLCSNVNCGPGARCFENEINNNYTCVCSEYTDQISAGMPCMAENFCARNPCMNNGTCTSSFSSFTCTCPFGFTGSMCQHNINDCLNRPCANGGQCQDLIGNFTCNCTGTGFEGDRCTTQVNDCASQPCNVTGTNSCQDLTNSYQCFCKPGYTGKNCESDIDECDSRPCLHNATCMNMENAYMCQCPLGWAGRNCETENKVCTSTTCLNGASCYDYFNGYFCKCQPNTFEKNCSSSVNVCQVANPCVHGTCQDKNGNADCICDPGYEGNQCETQQNLCSANVSVCKNDGQCIPKLDSYDCKCLPGYATVDCSYVFDYCTSIQCPAGATCYNTEEKAYCRCPLDKEGPNCDKAWDQDFDLLFDHEDKISMAYLPYPIKLNSQSFSISLWVQFGKKGDTGTFLSLFTVPKANSLRNKYLVLWIDEKAIYYNSNGTVLNITHDIDYNNDGFWHYLVVNVDRNAGLLHFIVDTINSVPVAFSPNGTFYDYIWLLLGAQYDTVTDMPVKDKGFYGKISRVTIYSRELKHREEVTIEGNTNVAALFNDSILRWSSELKLSTGVLRKAPSEADKSCPFGETVYPTCNSLLPGKRLVMIGSDQCPSDILQNSPYRLTQIKWKVPMFTGADSLLSSYKSDDAFVWGKYPVIIKASNTDGNSALCLFNIFVQNDNCTNPQKPPNAQELQCSPAFYEKYKQCSLYCMNNTAPSIASPRIHTCGPVGNWDPLNKFVPYRITPCGAISAPMQQLVINLRYSVLTKECKAVTETFEKELLKTQVNLNNEWDHVCTQASCNDTKINVTCVNKRRKRQASAGRLDVDVVLTLYNISKDVTSRSDGSTRRTQDLYRDLILAMSPNNPFNYSKLVSEASPNLNSINDLQMCNPPKVLLENECVDCGPGTFYNSNENECQFCPIGSYQPLSGQVTCINCSHADTTPTTGSYSSSDCYTACPEGQYMNLMNQNMCTNCSRGFYQPNRGQFNCLACPADKTTKYTGTVSASDCSNDCPLGQEIGTSNNCTDCRIGFYRGPNDPICQRCPTGNVTQNTSQTSVSDCKFADNPPGTKRRKDEPSLYDDCPLGTYQSEYWQFECIQCSPNYLTARTRSASAADCQFTCPAGQEKKQNEDSCVACALAFYRDGSKTFALCDSCPGNYSTLTTGSTSRDNCTLYRCGIGQQPNALSNGCEPCPKGTYQDYPDMPKCTLCSTDKDKSTRNPGAIKQEQCESYCPSGAEKNGSSCALCPIGYFKDNSEDLFGNCTRCRNSNFVTPGEGTISNDNCTVLNCQEGYMSNLTTLTCQPCPRGTYQNKKYQPDCILCPQNSSTRYTNSTRSEDCEMYCASGFEKSMNSCIPCRRGYYKDNTVDLFMVCTPCDIKYVTPEGPPATNASQCTVRNCSAGSFINGDNCTLCPRGTFQEQPWQTNCTACDIHRNTENEGSTKSNMCLLSCPAGTENNGVNATCDPCTVGYYKGEENTTRCTPCANFDENNIRITTVNGSTSFANCTKLVCLAGYYPVNNNCTLCGFGTYQPNKWRDSCDICPSGKTTYKTGAVNVSDCEPNCALGEGLVNGNCIKCEIGFYNDKSDPSRKECFKCPMDNITLQEGATSVSQCNIVNCSTLGQYRDPMDNMCKNCSIGTYQDMVRQDSCKRCSVNETTRYEKSTSSADCKKDCPSGSHLNDISNMCVPCDKGYYRNKSDGNWDCDSCPKDLTTEKTGSDKASDCSVSTCNLGTAYDSSVPGCVSCPVDTYADKRGQKWPCTPCPSLQITNNKTAVTSLVQCQYPCSFGDKCNIVTQECSNIQYGYRCDCRSDYQLQNGQCIHKCDIPNYCGDKGDCVRSPLECRCKDSYKGALCDIRPDAASMSDQEAETTIIAVVTTVATVLFGVLLTVSICVVVKKRKIPTPRLSEISERLSNTTRSMKGTDDYPTFAVNPAFSSKPPSVFGGPNGSLPSQGLQMYNNPTYSGDEDNDPAVYRA